jgi:phytoene synthase
VLLEALIDARLRDLVDRRFADMSELRAYAGETAGALIRLAARLLADEEIAPELDRGLEAAGRAWGLAGLARAFPAHAAAGFIVVPGAPGAAELGALLAARDAAAVRALTAPLLAAARVEHAAARRALADAPAALWPAYGYLALAPALIRALARPDADPFALAVHPHGLLDRALLVGAAVLGRI